MFKAYCKTAWRHIASYKLYSAINILGLTTGICACIAIYTIVSYELSFDNFHPGKERIYRVRGDITESTGDKLHFAKVPAALSLNGRSMISGIEGMANIIPYNTRISIPNSEYPATNFEGKTTVIAEPGYFNIFSYKWLAGNAHNALNQPFNVVLTESKARQYFGSIDMDKMIGRQVIYDDSIHVQVSGIVKDWDKNTDLAFTDFVSFATIQRSAWKKKINLDSWKQNSMSAWSFVKVGHNTLSQQVTDRLNALVKTHGDPETKLSLWLEPLSAIHFNANVIENPIRTAHMPTLYSLAGIALFILILAIINFINLSTAQSMQRAKETGIRKVLGSGNANLIFQFMTETLLLVVIAVLLGAALVNPVLAIFQPFLPPGVSFHVFDGAMIFFLVLLTVFISLIAGLYPAKIIASKLPAKNLKGFSTRSVNERWLFRKALIIFQFSISLVFIIASIVIRNQLKYTREKELGFNSDAIITVETPRGNDPAKVQVLEQHVQQIPLVNKVALQWLSPMTDNPRGMKLKFKSTDQKDFWVTQVAGNETFIPLYHIKLLAGRNLVRSDSVNEFVVNEQLSQLMGSDNPAESIGKILYWNDQPYPVVGVVADFHTSSLHEPITPLCIINRRDREGSLAIKLSSAGKRAGDIRTTILDIEEAWKKVYPDATFNYHFYDETLALLYEKDKQTAMLVNIAMGTAVGISCIGLFGLMLLITEKRKKEISVRKVLGAGIVRITGMLCKDFIALLLIALLIATPVAWYFIRLWLNDFAYRVPVSGWAFILAGAGMLFITLMTIGVQSIKAAVVNPAQHLRAE
jgi:putative ABC transport system permease protein